MEKYFIELLKSNKRLIIPKLGAFLKKEQGGKEVITFNQFLKFDDGLLINYVAEQEKIDKEKAKQQIQDIADKITKEINEGNQYKIKGLGSIYKDANGKIQFVEEGKETPTPESASEKKETTTKPTSKSTTTDSKTSTPPPKPKQPATGSTTPKQTDAEKLRQNILNQQKQTQTPGQTSSSSKPSQTISNKPTGSKFGSKPGATQSKPTHPRRPVPPPKRPTGADTRKSSSSGGGGKIVLWIILAIIVIGLGVFFLFFRDTINIGGGDDKHLADSLENAKEKIEKDEEELNKQFEEAQEETEPDSVKEAVKQDTAKEEKIPEPSEKAESKPEGKYFVVAGAFRDKANAEKYLNYLQQRGYNDARIFGMIRDMHAICYDSYPTKNTAVQAMQRIRNEMGRDKAWVYRP